MHVCVYSLKISWDSFVKPQDQEIRLIPKLLGYDIKTSVPHCPLRYAKVWGRDIVRSLTLAYAKRLFPDSNP